LVIKELNTYILPDNGRTPTARSVTDLLKVTCVWKPTKGVKICQ